MKKRTVQIESISAEELSADIVSKILLNYRLIPLVVEKDLETKEEEKSDEEFITIKKTCEIFKITKPTLNRWRKNGIVTDYRIGNGVRFKKSEILESLKKIQH
jgi:excisionase family DNA binding protein